MNKEYRYASRKLVLHSLFIPVLLVGGVFFILLLLLTLMAPMPHEDMSATPLIALMGLLILGLGFWEMYNVYSWAGTSLALTEQVLIYKTHNGVTSYPLEEVYLRSPSEHYERVIVIGPEEPHLFHRSGKIIWWHVVELQDSGMFLAELKERFDAKDLYGHYNPNKLSRWCAKAANHKRVK